jgi:hypothetical protein
LEKVEITADLILDAKLLGFNLDKEDFSPKFQDFIQNSIIDFYGLNQNQKDETLEYIDKLQSMQAK